MKAMVLVLVSLIAFEVYAAKTCFVSQVLVKQVIKK